MSGFEIVGVITAAPGLFVAIVDCFGRVQFGRKFGGDFESSVVTLNSVSLRFTRWGKAVGLDQGNFDPKAPFQISGVDENENGQAQDEMSSIIFLLEEAYQAATHYKNSNGGKKNDLTIVEEDAIKDTHVNYLLGKMKKRTKLRQTDTSFLKKLTWACYHKDRFDELIEKVSEHVTNLVELFPAAKEQQLFKVAEEVAEIKEGDNEQAIALNILRNAAVITDPMLLHAVEKGNEGSGHEFRENVLDDCEHVVYGNVNEGGSSAGEMASKYIGNRATKSKDIIYGNKTTHTPTK